MEAQYPLKLLLLNPLVFELDGQCRSIRVKMGYSLLLRVDLPYFNEKKPSFLSY